MTRPAEDTRDAIIKAAVYLFAEKGFDGTSVRDIVTKARVNQAAIISFQKQGWIVLRGAQNSVRKADD